MNNQMKYGLILGLAGMAAMAISYMVGHRFFLTWGSWLAYITSAVVMYKAATSFRESEGGFMKFGTAFLTSWVPYIIGSLLVGLFTYTLFNVFDPSLNDSMKEIQMEALEQLSSFLGEDGIEQAQELIDSNENMMTLGTTFLSWIFGMFFPGAIIALIVALITKRS